MTTAMTTIERVLNECEIRYHGELISREVILRDFACEIERIASAKGHTVGIMLHTGSKLFTAVAMVVSSVLCVAEDFKNTEEIVASLSIGDIVIIDNKNRAKYLGKMTLNTQSKNFECAVNGTHFGFETDSHGKTFYLVERINTKRIVPYLGTAKKLNGMGVRKTAFSDRIKFISYVWDADEKEVSSLVTKSFLFITNKEEATDVYENTVIKIKDKEYRLSSIVTATYFTENKEYSLGSNAVKEQPVLMIYSDFQEARKTLIEDSTGERRIAGLFVIGDEYLNGDTKQLLFRKGTASSYYSGKLDYSISYAELADSAAEFWTLTDVNHNTGSEVPKGRFLRELNLGARALSGGKIEKINVPDGMDLDKYREIRNACRWLKDNAHDAEEFIVQSFSLLNLLISAVFPLKYLDEATNDAELGRIDSTDKKLSRLQNLTDKFWGTAKETALSVINALIIERDKIYQVNPKGTELMSLMSGKDRPQAIIVPKAYYGHILRKWHGNYPLFAGVQIMTVGEAKNSGVVFDRVLFVCAGFGVINPQSVLIAPERTMLVYDCENLKTKLQERIFAKDKNAVLVSLGQAETEIAEAAEEQSITEEDKIEIDTDAMIGDLMFGSADRTFVRLNVDGTYQGAKADITRIVTFSGGEYAAYFTKRSSVYRVRGGKVEDVDVNDISEGDILLFSNTDEGRDLFKVFMKNLLDESSDARKEFSDAYATSLKWRKVLDNYIKAHGGAEIFVRRLKDFSIERDQMTVRQWADEDSHIIGPQRTEAEKIFAAIGSITGDAGITENAKQIADACSAIRSLRMRMLEAVKKIVVNKLNGKDIDPLFAPLVANINKLSIMLQAERVKNAAAGTQIPAYQTNRPIHLAVVLPHLAVLALLLNIKMCACKFAPAFAAIK